jgi:Fungal fucose-specific lectin
MSSNNIRRADEPKFHLSVCLIGFLLLVGAAYAHGQQVHQLSYNNRDWTDTNLNSVTTDSHTGIAAFATTPNDQLHAYYVSSNKDIHQLFFNGTSWADEDLTTLTAAPHTIAKSEAVGFSIQNFQYVFYVSSNAHVHQLLYNNANWADSDLTAATGGPASSAQTQLTALTTTPNNNLHVYYMASNGHINQLFNPGTTWQNEDLTAETAGPTANGVWMSGVNILNFQYVYYVASTGHIHELFYNNASWTDEDLTTLTNTSPAVNGSGVTALVAPGTKKIRVYMIASTLHVVQLASTNNKTWTSADLTKKTKGPLATGANGLVGFATTPNNQLHVYYVSGNHVNQLFLPTPATTWSNQDLTALIGGPPANGTSGMAGFSLQNLQYVYYVAN